MKRYFLSISALLCGSLAMITCSCNSGAKKTDDHVVVPAIDTTAMDLTVSPKVDFYRYTNGSWMANNPLKPEYGRYGTFDILRDSALNITHRIIEDLQGDNLTEDQLKVKTLYDLVMDSVKLNNDGAKPLMPRLERIDKISNVNDLADFLAESANVGHQYLFYTYVSINQDDSDKNILELGQPGLIMGDPDYYKDEAQYTTYQVNYRDYLEKLFDLVGTEEGASADIAKRVYETEKSLSKILYTSLELRDVERNWNVRDLSSLYTTYTFPWQQYFSKRNGLDKVEKLNVGQEDYFKRFDTWVKRTNIEDIKLLLKADAIDDAAMYLSDDFRRASFDFNGKVMSGLKEMKPRWKYAVDLVDGALGDVVGQIYTEKYFPAQSKERMTELVDNLKSALKHRIESLEWMSDETKVKALEKLSTFHVKIGYPNKWKNYDKLVRTDESLLAYIDNISEFETNKNIDDLNKPVDKDRWYMNAQTVNAYYNPTTNEICFPAGILQPPFFNADADDAVNYGAIGVVIGHEMTHGFDDQGRKFDSKGNMVNWWTADDEKRFNEAANKLADQYSAIQIAEGVNANGQLTLGENIADQGGLLVAYEAMKIATNNDDTTLINGWNNDQRFFIAYGRIWGQNIRPEYALRATMLDVHSLGEHRVNQAIKNIPAFYTAFDINEGDPMYIAPEDRVQVW